MNLFQNISSSKSNSEARIFIKIPQWISYFISVSNKYFILGKRASPIRTVLRYLNLHQYAVSSNTSHLSFGSPLHQHFYKHVLYLFNDSLFVCAKVLSLVPAYKRVNTVTTCMFLISSLYAFKINLRTS